MKIWEKVIERRIMVPRNLFEFMPGKLTMEPIFYVKQIAEKYRE